mmetsp:Transcript_56549/g.183837  ORF Transcript_56549/g.183837 Transcript_56549/m.183837 type:complete len:274 (+) Transcript_56549:445-1266(+)
MVHIKSDEVVEADPVNVLTGLAKLGVLNLGCHVLDLELRREVAQGTHEVGDLRHRDHAVQDARLRGALVLRPDLRVVEVVLHVGKELPFLATVYELHKGLDACSPDDARVGHRLRINQPLVDCEVTAATSERVLALVVHRDRRNLPGVCDEAHGLVRVAIKRQLYQAQDLFMSGVQHELILAVCILEDRRHLRDRVSIRRCQSCLSARPGRAVHRMPNLEFVLVVHGEHLLVVAFATKRVPNATGRSGLLLNDGVRRRQLQASKLIALHAVLH